MQNTRIVVLGGGYSGLMAAGRLARKLKGQQVNITLVNAAPDFIQRIRLHQLAADQSPTKIPITHLLKDTGVDFIQARVTQLNPQTQSLTLQSADGKSQPLNYDYLVYALGSFVDSSRVPGAAENAFSLGSEADSIKLRDRLADVSNGGRLVVCGGGLTGIEAAAELAETYPNLKVTLITRDAFGDKVSERGRHYLKQVFERLHIDVMDHANIQQITAHEVHYDGGVLAFDSCLWTSGFAVPALARQSGIKVNDCGQIIVNEHLNSISHPAIYAIGDAADASEATGTPARMACANAIPMGAYAADELAARLDGVAHRPHEIVDFYRCLSLGRNAGLIQVYGTDDLPTETVLTGRLAAIVKEMICRYTVWQVKNPNRMFFQHRPTSEHAVQSTKSAAHAG